MVHADGVLRCRDCTEKGVLQIKIVLRLTYHWASVQETPLAQLLVPPHCCQAPMVTLHVDAAGHATQVLEGLVNFCALCGGCKIVVYGRTHQGMQCLCHSEGWDGWYQRYHRLDLAQYVALKTSCLADKGHMLHIAIHRQWAWRYFNCAALLTCGGSGRCW